MSHYEDYKNVFQRDGFVIIRSCLTPSELQVVQKNVDDYLKEIVPKLPKTHVIYHGAKEPGNIVQIQCLSQEIFFRQYQQRRLWRILAEALLTENVKVQDPQWYPVLFIKPPRSDYDVPPHQDNYYFRLRPGKVVTFWLALDRVNELNGCLRYVVGSHLHGLRPQHERGGTWGIRDFGQADLDHEITAPLEPGDVVAHHGEVVHRSGSNMSESFRRGLAIVYRGSSCRRVDMP